MSPFRSSRACLSAELPVSPAADEPTRSSPPSLRVYRYRRGDECIRPIIGMAAPSLPHAELVARAAEALASRTFMFYTAQQQDDAHAHELCFVPKGDCCDILSIHTRDGHRRYGEVRRNLLDILSGLAAAVACGTLFVLDRDELPREIAIGVELLRVSIDDSASLALAREAAAQALREQGVGAAIRQRTVLGISEAATNILLHGGGRGHVTLRRLRDRLRFVVADQGDGLTFLNWDDRHAVDRPISMGYGLKIILDHMDAVGLFSSPTGTTLILDRYTD